MAKYDKRKLQKIIKEQPKASGRWLTHVAEEMVGDIKQSMTDSPASGQVYSRGAGRTHTASSPGNPPRPDMGALINSIRQRNVGNLHKEIVDGVEYGVKLELGTEKIAARPFVRPVFEEWRKKILSHAEKNLVVK